MSLILEALRKSEAERRRGQAPDVAMELPPAPRPRARAMPAWLPPAGIAGAILLLAGLWWLQRDAQGPRQAPAVATQAPPPPGPATVGTATPPLLVRDTAPATPPAAAPADAVQEGKPVPAHTETAPAQAPATPRPAEPMPAPPAPPPPPPSHAAVADIASTGLPPVKLSMHMWDEAPARRFVILDGQRLGEGEQAGGLRVVDIRRDGVVIERNGQHAFVPLP